MKSEILLEQGLARLQLPFFAKHHAAISSEAAQAAWSHGPSLRLVLRLVALQVALRASRRRRSLRCSVVEPASLTM